MVIIPLTKYGLITVVDDEFAHLAHHTWGIAKRNDCTYAVRMCPKTRKPIYLHHEVLPDCPEGMHRDHRFGQTLDNRLENLQIVTHAENIRNTSKIVGVGPVHGKWRAYASRNRRQISLGTHDSREAAIRARLSWEIKEWGRLPQREALYATYGL